MSALHAPDPILDADEAQKKAQEAGTRGKKAKRVTQITLPSVPYKMEDLIVR